MTLNPLYKSLNENIERLKDELGDSNDLSLRVIESPYHKTLKAAVIHLDGLADESIINDDVIDPLIQWFKENEQSLTFFEIEKSMTYILTVSKLTVKEDWDEFISAVLSGDTAVLLDGSSKSFITNTRKLQSRTISEPSTQTVVRGPKDSFTENLRTNTSLIRARVQNFNLRLESMKIGKITQTDVAIMYIQGITDESILQEIKKRLEDINVDGIKGHISFVIICLINPRPW